MEIQTVSSSQSWAHVTFHLTVPTLRKDSSFCSSPRVELLNLGTCPERKSKAHVQGSHPDSQRQWTERHFQSVSEVVNVARAGLRRPCCFLCWLINRKTRPSCQRTARLFPLLLYHSSSAHRHGWRPPLLSEPLRLSHFCAGFHSLLRGWVWVSLHDSEDANGNLQGSDRNYRQVLPALGFKILFEIALWTKDSVLICLRTAPPTLKTLSWLCTMHAVISTTVNSSAFFVSPDFLLLFFGCVSCPVTF